MPFLKYHEKGMMSKAKSQIKAWILEGLCWIVRWLIFSIEYRVFGIEALELFNDLKNIPRRWQTPCSQFRRIFQK